MNECPAVFSGPKNKKKFLEPLTIKFNVPFTDLAPDQEMCLSVSSQSNDVIRWSIQIVIYALKIDEKRDKMRLYIFFFGCNSLGYCNEEEDEVACHKFPSELEFRLSLSKIHI